MADAALGSGDEHGLSVQPAGELGFEGAHGLSSNVGHSEWVVQLTFSDPKWVVKLIK
jgi:hypothetical protein